MTDGAAGVAATAHFGLRQRTRGFAAAWRDWRGSVLPALLGFAVFRLLTEGVALLSLYGGTTPRVVRGSPEVLLRVWAHWDAQWYIAIATLGYARTSHYAPAGTVLSSSAFAPLFPSLIRGVMRALHADVYVAAFVVVNLSLLVALVGLHRLASLDVGRRGAAVALTLALAYPTAFFFGAIYADGLLLACLVWSFLAARTGHWWWAGILAGAAVLTKVFSIILAVALVVEYAQTHGWTLRRSAARALPAVVAPLAALALLMLYMAHSLGDPLSFVHAEAGWHHQLSAPWTAFAHAIADLRTYSQSILGFNGGGFIAILDIVTALLLLVVAGYTWLNLRRSYAVLILLSDLAFMCSGILASTSRYAITVFPLFIAGALWLRSRPRTAVVLVLGCAALSGVLVHGFVSDRWVG